MVDEFYFTSDTVATKVVLAAVIYVVACDIPQDYCSSLENLFQFSHIVDRYASFMDLCFPLLYFIAPCACKSLALVDVEVNVNVNVNRDF